jgi:outer membrane biosynthesis protein TonB
MWSPAWRVPVEVSAPVVAAMNDFVAEKYDTKAASGTARAASGRHIDTGLIEGLYDVIGGPLFESVWDQAEGLGAAFVAWAEQNEPKAFADWSEQWSASKRAAAQSDPRWMYAALEEKVRNGSAESMVRFVNALPDTEAARAVSAIHAVYAAGEKKKIKATTKPKAKPASVTKAKPKTAKKPAKAAGKKKAPTKTKAASAPAGKAKTKRKT